MWSFYKGSPDTINFHNLWHGNQTYLDKVKVRMVAMGKKFFRCLNLHSTCNNEPPIMQGLSILEKDLSIFSFFVSRLEKKGITDNFKIVMKA